MNILLWTLQILATLLYLASGVMKNCSDIDPENLATARTTGAYDVLAHALQQMTSWGGITLSGQANYTRIDPPLPNSCP